MVKNALHQAVQRSNGLIETKELIKEGYDPNGLHTQLLLRPIELAAKKERFPPFSI